MEKIIFYILALIMIVPDVRTKILEDGKMQISVHGLDYYDPKTDIAVKIIDAKGIESLKIIRL